MSIRTKNHPEFNKDFAKLGFLTKTAFVNICLSIDKSISLWQLNVCWDYGIYAAGLENKIDAVIEILKHE